MDIKCYNPVSTFFRTLIWEDGLGGLSWSSVAVYLSPWCTELPVFLAALRMSTHSCIILWLTVAVVGAVTHIHTTVSALAKCLITNALWHLAAWRTRTSTPWQLDNIQSIRLENYTTLSLLFLCIREVHVSSCCLWVFCFVYLFGNYTLLSMHYSFIEYKLHYLYKLHWIHGINEFIICACPHQTRSNFCVSGLDTQ